MRPFGRRSSAPRRGWVFVTLIFGLIGPPTSACQLDRPETVDVGIGAGVVDSDADAIPDSVEGSSDSDGDGVPDRLDRDSDGDGIEDIIEAGDILYDTPPVDSDGDGTADFLDDDSDDNGISDRDEGLIDYYDDGIVDFRDLDDDNDGVSDADEISGAVDCDQDGEPDPPGTPADPLIATVTGCPTISTRTAMATASSTRMRVPRSTLTVTGLRIASIATATTTEFPTVTSIGRGQAPGQPTPTRTVHPTFVIRIATPMGSRMQTS